MVFYYPTYPYLSVYTIDDWEDDRATVIEADTYHAARGNDTWTGTDTVKQEALTRAWDYLRGLRWNDNTFATELPGDVKSAHIVAALRELVDPGCLLPDIDRNDFLDSKNIAGVIVKNYKSGSPAWNRYREIEVLLRPYVVGQSNIETLRG